MFEIKNVTKLYGGEYALKNISMTIGKGLNFLIGSSGSGKTTLLKIISSMEQNFEGDVFFCGKSVKNLSEEEKSYYYSNVFGFVWQDFNLLEDLTVLSNVMLPQYLKSGQDDKAALKILRELKISELANQKVSNLSGGQKQRVAIARELMKNPEVIIADEPTGALDEKSAKTVMEILRDISRSRTVIVVTHDTSLISQNAKVYELDKGELIFASDDFKLTKNAVNKNLHHKLSFKNTCTLSAKNTIGKPLRFLTAALSLLIAASLLLVTLSGTIENGNEKAFDKLLSTYGQEILDINIVGGFTSAGGTDGAENDKPNADVSQDIGGLYEKYKNDERVSHILFAQAFSNIKVSLEDKTEYEIQSSGSVPTVNELIVGVMPMGEKNQVVVPESFVKKLQLTNEEALGKILTFNAAIYNWDSGNPVLIPVNITAEIVGVADTSVKQEYDGKITEYSIDDSFFFSQSALSEMRKQAKVENKECNFTLRAKTPQSLISIKDEMNSNGIVPLGRFELVEDMVRLSEQTKQQSGFAVIAIAVLAVIIVLVSAFLNSFTRRREYAIYKVSGYSSKHLAALSATEALISAVAFAVLFLLLSPLTNLATTAFWGVNILTCKLLFAGILTVIAMCALSFIVALFVCMTAKAENSLKSGEK